MYIFYNIRGNYRILKGCNTSAPAADKLNKRKTTSNDINQLK